MPHARLDPRAISTPAHIELLASSVRQEIVDTLSALGGEASVPELAQHIGSHMDGMYYHMRLLCKAGLVIETDSGSGRERRFRLPGRKGEPLRLAYRPAVEGNSDALRAYMQGLVQVAARDFEGALAIPGVVTAGKRRQLWAARNKGWVSSSDLEEINRLLERLCELASQPRADNRNLLVSLVFALAPSPVRSKRRASPCEDKQCRARR
ncbi:MAG: winged helix-turn-helix domain-containing protein [Lysobacterales bacterium]